LHAAAGYSGIHFTKGNHGKLVAALFRTLLSGELAKTWCRGFPPVQVSPAKSPAHSSYTGSWGDMSSGVKSLSERWVVPIYFSYERGFLGYTGIKGSLCH